MTRTLFLLNRQTLLNRQDAKDAKNSYWVKSEVRALQN
jgi:hypothetical protein